MNSLENKIIYQIYPKSFKDTNGSGVGDISGVIEKLDYLKELGVDYIWLSPIMSSPQCDNGYDIADYYKIDPMFGTNEDYYSLIEEAKKRDMKIMMDLVLNHSSDQHEWFKNALNGDEKYYDYYIFRDEPNDIGSFFGGNAWSYCDKLDKYYFRLFDKGQPDLNWENEDLRQDMADMINFWIEKGVEGFRLDVIDLIGKEPDNNILGKGPKFYEYLKELNNRTFGKDILTVGECWGSTIEESYKMCNDDGLTQAFHFHRISLTSKDGDKWNKQKLDLQGLADICMKWQNNYSGIEALVMNNHDAPRLISIWLDDKEYRKESAKLAITIYGVMKGNLYIYQGEEIGLTNAYMDDIKEYRDIETLNKYTELMDNGISNEEAMDIIKKTSRDNARVPMPWDDSFNGGFSTGEPWIGQNPNYKDINVAADRNSEDSIYEYYKNIIRFRKDNYEKIDSKMNIIVDGDVFVIKKEELEVVANFGSESIGYCKKKSILSNYQSENLEVLRPYEVCIYEC